LELTRLSGKGQVVIPTEMRRRMGLREGTRFLVVGLEDTIILRKLRVSEEKLRLRQLLAQARVSAKKRGLSKREIERLIHAVRKVSE